MFKIRLKYAMYYLWLGMLQSPTAVLKTSRLGEIATLAGSAFHWTTARGKKGIFVVILAIVINLAKIDRSLFLKLRKRLAGCVPMPRDSSESDLVDSAFYRVYGFIQIPSAFKWFYRSIG